MTGLYDMIFSQTIEGDVKTLFSTSKNVSIKTFSLEQIKNLSEPIQRYFTYCLEEDQYYVSYVKLKQTVEFRPDENQKWMPIEGEEYSTTDFGFYLDWKNIVVTFSLDYRN